LDLALELGELLLQQLELLIELLDFLSGLLFSQFEVVKGAAANLVNLNLRLLHDLRILSNGALHMFHSVQLS